MSAPHLRARLACTRSECPVPALGAHVMLSATNSTTQPKHPLDPLHIPTSPADPQNLNLGIHPDRHGAVIGQGHFHIRAELAGLGWDACGRDGAGEIVI